MPSVALRLQYSIWLQDRGWKIELVSLYTQTIGSARTALLCLLGAVGLVLLIACVNIASLQLMRAEARRREMAVRLALGAGRSQLVRQLLFESVVLALVGGFAGVLIAYWGIDLLVAASDARIPHLGEIRVDGFILFCTLCLTTAIGLLSGLAPALEASRTNLDATLRESGLRAAGSQRAIASAVSFSSARSDSLSSLRSAPVYSLRACSGWSASTRDFVATMPLR